MPGRLIMDHQSSTTGSQDLKKDRSQAQEGAVQRPQGSGPSPVSQPNGTSSRGANGALPNGVAHTGGVNATSNGGTSDVPPPPLDQSWRHEASSSSMGKLMERVAQWCFNELNTLVTELAQQPIPQQGGQTNGVVATEDTDEVSLNKKRKVMEFAQTQRDRFIRALVISEWSRNADDVANVIDINLLLRKNDFCVSDAIQRIGQMKIDSAGAKMPNPNIELAMELLSTGKAHKAPDFGYLPPEPLTAKQLLKIMKEMNVTLATRLALHEDIPELFRSYSIANGRATFVVPGEFEVDLTVVDDDLKSTFFFIDLRFLFTPAPSSLEAEVRTRFEVEVNRAIMLNGLQGCYDTLHDFVLTHKIEVLAQQATDLTRGKWFNCIGVERMRRNLVLSYWTGRSGPKSWLEFGVASGNVKGKRSRKPVSPCISLRWFQRGIEVKDAELDIDWEHLDAEAILSQAIAKHTSSILRSVDEGLRSLGAGEPAFIVESQYSESDPNKCALLLKLDSLQTTVCVKFEPVTGQYSISPPTAVSASTQEYLNGNANADVPKRLASMICAMSLERGDVHFKNESWRHFTNIQGQDNLAALLGTDFWHWRIYSPTPHWGHEWAVAVTSGLSGNKWWVVQLTDSESGQGRKILRLARPLDVGKGSIDRILLMHIEKVAMAEVSFTAAELQLRDARIAFYFDRPSLTLSDNGSERPGKSAMYLPFSKLMRDTRNKSWRPWAHELVRLTHHGSDRRASAADSSILRVRHDVRMTLKTEFMKQLRKHIKEANNRDVALNKTAGFALRFYTAFGASFVDQMQERLTSFKRLDEHVDTLEKLGLQCDAVNLSRLSFTYATDPPLSAHLTFSADNQPTKLKLEPTDTNPHHRLRIMLEQLLNDASNPNAFSNLAHILLFTLPVLRTFETLRAKLPSKLTPILQPRSPTHYSLKYKPPHPQITFILRARTKLERGKRCMKWQIEQERTKSTAESLPENLISELRELWNGKSESWIGTGAGLVTDVRGIAAAMESVDVVVRRHEVEGVAKVVDAEVKEEKPDVIAIDD